MQTNREYILVLLHEPKSSYVDYRLNKVNLEEEDWGWWSARGDGGGGRWRRSAGCCDAASSGSRVPEYADIYVMFIELKKEMTANLDL